ncbi:MAG TPA: 4Fe-4S single cluster domain-containing protein [Acidimicrobiales bacterium]|jgi:anaerobic ribonucleoside-triphosphate reductase activating protein
MTHDLLDEPVPLLNVGSFLPSSSANGPGRRAVLWLQGCDLRCAGCYNPELLAVREHRLVRVDVVAEAISRAPGLEGVTYSGGEPTLQSAALARLSSILRARGLTVMCYTGHVYEELVAARDPDVLALLEHVDLLVDGPYQREWEPGGVWRGSANQRLIPLSDRYADLRDDGPHGDDRVAESSPRLVELHVSDSHLHWTGVFPPALVRQVAQNLQPDHRAAVGTVGRERP